MVRISIFALKFRQVRSQEFAVGELFWRLETTPKDLDPDFDWSLLKLGQFFCPNLGDVQKKKRSSFWLEASFSWSGITSGSWLILIANTIRELFSFLEQKLASKVLKTWYFAYSLGQWRGGARAPPTPGYATEFRGENKKKVFSAKFQASFWHSLVFFRSGARLYSRLGGDKQYFWGGAQAPKCTPVALAFCLLLWHNPCFGAQAVIWALKCPRWRWAC